MVRVVFGNTGSGQSVGEDETRWWITDRLTKAHRNGVTTEEFVRLGRLVHRRYSASGDAIDVAFRKVYNLACTLSDVKANRPHLLSTIESLEMMLARLFSDSLPLIDDFAFYVAKRAKSAADVLGQTTGFARVGLQNYVRFLKLLEPGCQARERAIEVIQGMFPGEYPWGIPENDLREAREHADEAAQRIASYRHFGVKGSVLQDGLLHSWEQAWTFYDGIQEFGHIGGRTPLALTHLTNAAEIRSLKRQTDDSGGYRTRMVRVPYDVQMMVVVQMDGSLTLDPEYGVRPLERAFDEAGRAEAYQYFRLLHLMRVADQVLPTDLIVRLGIPAWPVMPELRKQRERSRPNVPRLLRDLRIPRQRILRQPGLVADALRAEVADAWRAHDVDPQAGTKKKVKHWVPGFPRKLAAGTVAGPQAAENAWKERRLVLKPGYTFVPGHNRGSREDPDTIGHRLVRRPRES